MTGTDVAPGNVLGARVRRWRGIRPAYLFPIAALVLWIVVTPFLPTERIPMPWKVLIFMWDELRLDTFAPHSVYFNFAISFARLGIGTITAMVIGAVVGVASGLSRDAAAFFRDYIVASLTLPGLIIALVAALWFGFGFLTPVVTVVIATFAYTATNIAEGVRAVPHDLLLMARSFRLSRRDTLRHVVIPSLVPFFFVSLRYTLSLGWKALTIAEIFGADTGAGWMLRFWYDANRLHSLLGYTFFFVIMTVLLDRVLFKFLEARLLRWRGDVSSAFRR